MTVLGAEVRMPRLGFAGAGWIGMSRMRALLEARMALPSVCFEPNAEAQSRALQEFPNVRAVSSFEELLANDVDGVVIATPSALHREQCLQALRAGKPVFCQKPLARSAHEVREIIQTAEAEDRLLGCDFSYRFTAAAQAIRSRIREGAIGQPFAADLTFHNAYGPDKPWYYDLALAGGGCVMDLGIHLIDLLGWWLNFPSPQEVCSRLFCRGKAASHGQVEDFAEVQFVLNANMVARITCSWNLPAGQDAVIQARLFGTEGGLCFSNVNGSFYDFAAEQYTGTSTRSLTHPPDAWSGRAITAWAKALTASPGFRKEAHQFLYSAQLLDATYQELRRG